jgi:hypothetical protein
MGVNRPSAAYYWTPKAPRTKLAKWLPTGIQGRQYVGGYGRRWASAARLMTVDART